MSDWVFKNCHENSEFRVGYSENIMGDAFSPAIPPDRISTFNWTVRGIVKLYAADMTFLGDFGPGERMMITDPAQLAMGKCVLVAATDDVIYYCMREANDGYLDGEIVTLLPNEVRTFTSTIGKRIFVSKGTISHLKEYANHSLLNLDTLNEITLTAGADGAIIVLFSQVP